MLSTLAPELVAVGSKNSCGVAEILEQATEPLPTTDSTSGFGLSQVPGGEQENVAFPLVISLPVIMINEIGHSAP